MDLSYAANLEDYHLARAFEGQASGFYIDVGAGHPVADNVSCWFYLKGWHGIVIEPQPPLIELYPQVRPRDIPVGKLLGRTRGEADFHLVDRLHRFYVSCEEEALIARFPKTPAPWLVVPHLGHTNRAPERSDHPDHAFARALVAGFLAKLPRLDPKLLRSLLIEESNAELRR